MCEYNSTSINIHNGLPMNQYHIISILVLTAVFTFEHFFPFQEHYKYSWKHLRRNCVLGGINGFLTSVTSATLSFCVICWTADNNFGLLRMLDLPPWLIFGLAVLIFDVWIYSWHIINHRIPLLWRFHRVHHSDPSLDVTTALRFHPGEIMLSSMLNVVMITLLGMQLEHLILYKGIFHANVVFHHSNIRLPERIDRLYRTVLVSPNMHRIHHSEIKVETDSNFSSVFTFWDRMFGTYRVREDMNSLSFGLDKWMEEKWQSAKGLLFLPFQSVKNPKE